MCDISVLESYKFASGKLVTHVYDYWKKKREKQGRALIRRFQPPTSINDTSPHSTFRPREREEKRMRRTRMKDKDAHKNLKQFHADFRRAKELLEQLVKREKAKKALLQLDFCLKFARDIKDIPSGVIKQQEEFFKEWYRDRDKAKQQSAAPKRTSTVAAADAADLDLADSGLPNASNLQLSTVARNRPVIRFEKAAAEAEPVMAAADMGEGGEDWARKLEGIKRCFQRLMRSWDGGADSCGTSLLPLTPDGRLLTSGAASSATNG